MTCRKTYAASSPEGLFPGRNSDSTGLPEPGIEDVDRLEAVAARMRVEEDEFLLAMRRVVRVVDIEHDAARHAGEAVAEQVDHAE